MMKSKTKMSKFLSGRPSPERTTINVVDELADALRAQALEGTFSSRKLDSIKYRHTLWTEGIRRQLRGAQFGTEDGCI